MNTVKRHLVVAIGLTLFSLPVLAQTNGSGTVQQSSPLTQAATKVKSKKGNASTLVKLKLSTTPDPTPISGSIQLGIGYLNQDSYKFGEWTGLSTKGGYPLANVTIGQIPAWDSSNPNYWVLRGENLGLKSRTLSLQIGSFGSDNLTLSYQGIPHYEWQDALTPYSQVGENKFVLPSGFGGVDVSSASAWQSSVTNNLDPNLHTVNLMTDRQITKIQYTTKLTPHWTIMAQFRHDKKQGLLDFGSVIDGNGFSPASVLLPLPISYKINRIRFQGTYHTRNLVVSLGYLGSFYHDNLTSYEWQSAFTGESTWVNGAWPNGEGLAATPPDNMFNQGLFSGSWDLPSFYNTHVIWDASWGVETQDASLLPYTINTAVTTVNLPTLNANSQVKTTQDNLRIVTSPTERMELVAAFRYHDHADNSESFAFYPVYSAQTQSTTAYHNLPYSYRRETVKLALSYDLGRHIRPFIRYRYQEYHREFVAVGRTRSNRVLAGLNMNVGPMVQFRLTGDYGRRNGSFYMGSYRTQLEATGVYVAAADTNPTANLGVWEWDPLMQMFWFANRTRTGGQFSVDVTPPGPVYVSLNGQYNNDSYSDTTLGLLSNRNQTYSLDVGYTPSRTISSNAYFTYQRINWGQAGIYFPGFNYSQAFNFADYWHLASSQPMYMAGLNVKDRDLYIGLPHPVGLTFNASYSYSSAGIDVTTGSALASKAGAMPQITMRCLHFGVTGNYHFSPRLALQLGVAWERYLTSNWQYTNVAPGTIGPSDPAITMGIGSPDYSVTWTTLAIRYLF